MPQLSSRQRQSRIKNNTLRMFDRMIEQLEDRRLLTSVIIVNSLADGPAPDGSITLRAAIETLSNATTEDVQIFFDSNVFNTRKTLTLSQGAINFFSPTAHNVRVVGPSAGLIIDAGSANRILDNIFGNLTLENLTFTGGNAPGPSGTSTDRGGAILNEATLTIKSCLFLNNKARDAGGAIYNIADGTLNVFSSLFYANRVTSGDVEGSGGAIGSLGQANIFQDTFVNNTAFSGSAIAMNSVAGHTMNLGNSIIQDNISLLPGFGETAGAINSLGKNIIHNFAGTSGLSGNDFLGSRVALYELGEHGGASLSMPPVESPDNIAIDGGDSNLNPQAINIDQRGFARYFSVSVDIGAVEVQEHISVSKAPDQTAFTGVPQSFSLGTVTGRASNPPWTVDVNWGDGSDALQITNVTSDIPAQFHSFNRPGIYTVTVVASDANNLKSNPSTYKINVTGNFNANGTITPSVASLKLPAVVVPGDRGTIGISLLNSGTLKASGAVETLLYLSTDTVVDNNDFAIATISLVGQKTTIPAGGSSKVFRSFLIPNNIQPGNYFVLAVTNALSGFTNSVFSVTPAASAGTFQVVQGFGKIGTRKGVKTFLTDPDDTIATFSIAGPGTAELVFDANSTPSIVLSNTTLASKVSITTKNGDKVFTIRNITSESAIGSITGKSVNISGNLIFLRDCKSMTLGNLTGVNQIRISGATPTTLTLGNVKNTSISTNGPIKSLLVSSWTDDDVTADTVKVPNISLLTSKANFQPSLTLTGSADEKFVAIKSAVIKGSVGEAATWQINGNVTSLSIGGSVPVGFSANIKRKLGTFTVAADYAGELAAANIGTAVFKSTVTGGILLAGADFGADGVFAGSDNTYAAGTIKSLTVAGGVSSSKFAAGVDFNTNTLIEGGKIAAALFKGSLSDDSDVLAKSLPARVKVDGALINTSIDPRFELGILV